MLRGWSGIVALVVVILGAAYCGFLNIAPGAHTAAARVPPEGFQGQWVSIGPTPVVRNAFANASNPQAPFSGRIGSIAVDPTDLNHWLLGVGNGGVWETRDAGGSWVPLTDAAPTLATGDVTFDPTNPRTIYVGTGEAHGSNLARCGLGILKSTDGGRTWTLIGAESFARGSVKRLRVNPGDPSTLMAASARGGYGLNQDFPGAPPPFGVLKSSDAGQTWTRKLAGQATALEIDPSNFDRQYAAIGENVTGQSTSVDANGVYRSTDGGENWKSIAGPWPASSPTQLASGRIELALAPSNRNILYASISQTDGSRILGLYRTDNAWDDAPTWRQISTAQIRTDIGLGVSTSGSYCVLCNYAHVLSVNPADPNTVFAGGKALLWRCTNCGSAPQWSVVPGTNANTDTFADQQAAVWAGSRLILGNDGGIFSTFDLGTTWQNHNAPISTTMFYNGALHPSDPNFIIGGARDHGLVVRGVGSLTWASRPSPQNLAEWGGEGEVALSTQHPETYWMASGVGQIWRTTDGGKTASRVDAGLGAVGNAVRKCPANDDVFLTSSTRLWRTDNFFNSSAPSWSANGPVETGPIYGIAFDATDATCNTYAYGASGRAMLTRDGGATWVDLNPSKLVLPPFSVNGIAFDPTNRDTIYLAFSNFSPASLTPRHIYKTINASASQPTWVNISPPEDVPFDVIVVDPADPKVVYAGSDTGLWGSRDGGVTWHKFGPDQGLPHATIFDIEINPATNQTIVFTHGRGAFEWHASDEPTQRLPRRPRK